GAAARRRWLRNRRAAVNKCGCEPRERIVNCRNSAIGVVGRRGFAVLAALLAGACTYTGSPMGAGSITFQIPGTLPPSGGLQVPPSLRDTAQVIAPAAAPQTGPYAGVGRNIDDPGGMCADPIRITRFFV